VSLSQGELYTFVTNKAGKGKKGTLVASIKGTLAKDISLVLMKLSVDKRLQVKEITLDMAKNMEAAVKSVFANAILVTDRFHVAKLALDALQHLRVKKRWEEMDKENDAIKAAREAKKRYEADLQQNENNPARLNEIIANVNLEQHKYNPEILENGDTPKQLLARCRYILAKKKENWTQSQQQRAAILFKKYPELENAYHQILAFRNIYEDPKKESAEIRFNKWIKEVAEKEMTTFYTVANTVKNNLDNILNFFINRNTNANAESFNSKIKLFRANQRGVVDTKFFLFRLHKLFA
jgi:transposase